MQDARSHGIPVIEGLGDRRVPAALLHDVAVVTAATADSRGMTVDNNAEAISIQIKIYTLFDRVADDRLDSPPCLWEG